MHHLHPQSIETVQAFIAFDWSRYEPAVSALSQRWDEWATSPWEPESWAVRLWPDGGICAESFHEFAAVLTEVWGPHYDASLFTAGIQQLLVDIYQPEPVSLVPESSATDLGTMGSLFDDDATTAGPVYAMPPGEALEAVTMPLTAGVPATVPNVFGGRAFTPDEAQRLLVARQLARTMAEAAHKAVTKPDLFTGILKEYFGSGWESADDYILRTYRAIARRADEVPLLMYGSGGNERLVSSMADGSAFAYTEFGHAIFLAEKFWSLSPAQQGSCILHELSHFVDADILDRSTFSQRTGLGRMYGFECVTNAYSYQLFAEQV
ncbi:hypothetical protein ACIQUL_29885 [Streptomyces sp. NPDC090303]|uniref:hypothetical protein n=1 Tax=Streptomyces sp. NPDC090303 TaxID=3365960 RepID=UPI00382E2B01